MNRSSIEYVDYTWNPLTGCHHGCWYCWARRFAKRLAGRAGYDADRPFEMTLHRDRLGEPTKVRKPSVIAPCWMGDLFGEWVPHDAIREVARASMRAVRHRYLWLTKNPRGYAAIDEMGVVAEDSWLFGVSATGSSDTVARVNTLRGYSPRGCERWLSLEPLLSLEGIAGDSLYDLPLLDWIVIGTLTGNPAMARVRTPDKAKVVQIVEDLRVVGVPVFVKDSARKHYDWPDAPQEVPW